MGENIAYNAQTAKEVILNLLIDDGVPDRVNRFNIFNADFEFLGACKGPHLGYNTMTTIIYNGKIGSGADFTKKEAILLKAKLEE